MPSILIIKTGASGDVVRTTVLLQALDADVYWITSRYNLSLFADEYPRVKAVVAIDAIPDYFFDIHFDRIINLEEQHEAALLAARFHSVKRVGVQLLGGRLTYDESAAAWFDMSRISRFGLEKANELKFLNRLSYQQHIYPLIEKTFAGERYGIYKPLRGLRKGKRRIGLEKRSGDVWPNKQWGGYGELETQLAARGFEVFVFPEYPSLREYMSAVNNCDLLISGDTLCMHLALAYQIPAIALFNCTSPQEIYDYGLLQKITSPLLARYYYQTGTNLDLINSISVAEVMDAVNVWADKFNR